MKHLVILLLLLVLVSLKVCFSQGSAVITLEMPPGARQAAMGEGGTALKDVDSWYYNPALPPLSFDRNKRALSFSFFKQNLLPILELDGLEHKSFLLPGFYLPGWGYIAFQSYMVSFGENDLRLTESDKARTYDSKEYVNSITLATDGLRFFNPEWEKFPFNVSLGSNIEYYYSALAPGISGSGDPLDGIAHGFSFDVGIAGEYEYSFLEKQWNQFNLNTVVGAVFQNIGTVAFYVGASQADPIPTTFSTGITQSVSFGNLWKLDGFNNVKFSFRGYDQCWPMLTFLITNDIRRPIHQSDNQEAVPSLKAVYRYITKPGDEEYFLGQIIHRGFEFKIFNFLSLRRGALIDPMGERFETHYGFGIASPFSIYGFNFEFSISNIKSHGDGIRTGQTSNSFKVTYQW